MSRHLANSVINAHKKNYVTTLDLDHHLRVPKLPFRICHSQPSSTMICPYGRPKHCANPITRRCTIKLYLYSRPFLLPCMYCRQGGDPLGDSSEPVHSSSHRSNNLKTLPFTHTQLISNKPYSGTCVSGAVGFITSLNLPLICFSFFPPTPPPHQDAGVLCAKDRISFSRRRLLYVILL